MAVKRALPCFECEIYLPLLLFVVKLKNEIAIEGKRFIDWKMCIKSTRAGDLHDRFYLANNNSLEPNCANCVLCPRYSVVDDSAHLNESSGKVHRNST